MKKITRFLLAMIMIFSLSACGNADKKTEEVNNDVKTETKIEEKKDDKESADKKEDAEEAEVDLPDFEGRNLNVVATSDSYVPLFDKFSELTGAKVEFLSMSSGEVITRAKAEGKPMADLWFGGGLDAFMAAKEDGLLDSYKSEMTDKVPERFRDEEGYYTSKGLTVVGFIVNDQILEEKGLEAPKTWKDLAKEEYKGEIIMSNPAISGTNYAALKGLLDLYGEEEGWALFEKINENIDFYSKRGKDPQEKTAQGEFAIGIIPVDKKAFDAARDNGLSVVYPEDGVSWVPEGVAVFKDSENADVAKAFEDFMLTKEAQKMIAEIDGKDTNQLIVEGAEGFDLGLPKDKLVDEDLSTFGTKRDEILNKFKEIAKDKAREE
ncbi:MAG: ABC transporter substrate-binding protein [Anaerococcus prevotii]|uniref:ABC transporter substrate-binding protein n=1 Tax=Anaerococcus prevotii TaxID=33034 RepID=UPI0028FFD0D4|nr:ABC transporter substrate-binding protein [Anaerococcus prevotii]MDU2557915.1 ABC transporter substrate-binding protein [Anaerococcus prevotii]MDU2584245.1 ABC transporter substrate-binding protein [Anaerococcus prevotii]MDU3135983.1 ABC transporter substrate-binding protein [Anaerococcus prevotii]